MATTANSIPSPGSPVSQEDRGLWMKLDFNSGSESTEMAQGNLPQAFNETSQEDKAAAPVVKKRYYSVMDDEIEDDVFILPPPPPSCMAPSPPAGGSAGGTDANLSVTITGEAGGVTEAKGNLTGLERHHGERRMPTPEQDKVDEATGSERKVNRPKGPMEAISPAEEEDTNAPREWEQATVSSASDQTQASEDPAPQNDNTTGRKAGDLVSSEETGGVFDLIDEKNSTQEDYTDRHKYPNVNMEESATDERNDTSQAGKKGSIKKSKEPIGECEGGHCVSADDSDDTVENTSSGCSGGNMTDCDFQPNLENVCCLAELCKREKNKTGSPLKEAEVPGGREEVTGEDEGHVDTQSVNYSVTKEEWVRRDSASAEIPLPHLPISRDSSIDREAGALTLSAEQEGRREESNGCRAISTVIQEGEQLLQRLQCVQQRQGSQDLTGMPPPSQQVVMGTTNQTPRDSEGKTGALWMEEEDLAAEGGGLNDEEEEGAEPNFDVERGKTKVGRKGQSKRETGEDCEIKETSDKATASSSAMPVDPSRHRVSRIEADYSDDDQSDSGVSADFSPVNMHELPSNHILILSACHEPSSAEASTERDINRWKKDPHRARGLFKLRDNPDVLEIPFKTNILPKPLPSKAAAGQSLDWQFTEQKMQKEISQEFQRELVLVNQGTIPGEYRKGEIRQLKDTKLLFEAFQQGNPEGPTRLRKPPSSTLKDHVYPSVLERTRSLEMLSLKAHAVSRTNSLRLLRPTALEPEKRPESFRSRSPVGCARDSARLSPYPKQDKHHHLHRSMDSLSIDAASPIQGAGSRLRQRNKTEETPIMKENPFFKLRPALALQPEVQKDILEARDREEELRRQRCTLYGETSRRSQDEDNSATSTLTDARRQSKGKLDRIWPPPSKKGERNSGQTQEPKAQKAGGQKPPLWQRWEAGMTNGEPSQKKN